MTATKEAGVCNTRLEDKSVRPVEAGIDTWRLCRYLDDDRDLVAVERLLGPRATAPEKVCGHTVGLARGARMLWLEGHPGVDRLAPPTGLASAEDAVLSALSDAGFPVGRDGGVGRLDQTVTLRFPEGRQGVTFLAGLAAVDVPRVKPAVYGRPPETVYLRAELSGKVLARVYDKGIESRSAPRGELIRLENQTRPKKDGRMRAAIHAENPEIAEALFRGRFAPVCESADGLTAATLPMVVDRVYELVESGEMSYRKAERLVGFLQLAGRERVGMNYRTRRRRRAELREHGLVLANPLEDPVEVDLAEGLDAALAAWTDEAQVDRHE